ncbi:hypothetical protein EST38_g7988 [Candolleomyces aberdarensis]|uniref:DUF6589 domain-containing protein n=1 Tax=Candolleomyces aberdarensis TaxID=2316362 RepID=A0A4Q2DGK5_9AGAR|nr:hypothetical protein EST38_g7988 [Candolleomyces aberdarensis]
MSLEKQKLLKDDLDPNSGTHHLVVSDNVQVYARQRDPRMGRENKMITGMAATAIPMEAADPEAFNLKILLDQQAKQERKNLTTDQILNDIDGAHLNNVAAFQFLQALIHYVPALSHYQKDLKKFTERRLRKFARPEPLRPLRVVPLATNGANEMHVQELKEAVSDFAGTQLGINEETLRERCWVFSGDGKTFDMLHRLRKFMAVEEGNFDSFRWLVPLLELWHTKWTDMSRVVRAHWGDVHDPSSLAHFARKVDLQTPPNLRKVDFYYGSHLINLVLDAHLINCWENHYNTSGLVTFFEHLSAGNQLPKFDDLVAIADSLAKNHATTQAYELSKKPGAEPPPNTPAGSPWLPKHNEEAMDTTPEQPSSNDMFDDIDLPLPDEVGADDVAGDTTLANTILFLRDAIWWREVCLAVAEGDTGRVLEMFKIWIFTFAGSKNPLYSSFLLEIYCNFKYEFSEKLREAILMYWVVNLSGLPGCFIELDLLQEHFNFWLEQIVQHKGKEFDDPFYREVVAMNVHHFLRLKDEMEEAVLLKARTKRHTAPHLDNEMQTLLEHIRTEELNKFRAGRTEGFEATDNFGAGVENLKGGKLDAFIARSTAYFDILRMHMDDAGARKEGESPTEESMMANLSVFAEEVDDEVSDELDDKREGLPPPRMVSVNGDVCMLGVSGGEQNVWI